LGRSSQLHSEKVWKALHFKMLILKKGNSNTKILAYMSRVHTILEYGVACWNPYREGQISALDRVQKKVAKFAHHMYEGKSKIIHTFAITHL